MSQETLTGGQQSVPGKVREKVGEVCGWRAFCSTVTLYSERRGRHIIK